MDSLLTCKKNRRFGIEIELNSLDGDLARPKYNDKMPEGSRLLASLVRKATREGVEIMDWDYTNNNDCWIIKPDMSCGIELCSPILKDGWGMDRLLWVIDAIRESKLNADDRCSLHIHVNVGDFVSFPHGWLESKELTSVVCHWIKCEPVFLDAMPPKRKINTYCPAIGMTDLVQHDTRCDNRVVDRLSHIKYYTINMYHMRQGRRPTIEFRIADNEACIDPVYARNWIRLILHFVEMTKYLLPLRRYRQGDSDSGLVWLDPLRVFQLLGFDRPLDCELMEVRGWFLERIKKYNQEFGLPGAFSGEGRSIARDEVTSILGPMIEKQMARYDK